eukprot:scaffold928_cov370-Prasinococcus_capsulatus_cf.AAC.23
MWPLASGESALGFALPAAPLPRRPTVEEAGRAKVRSITSILCNSFILPPLPGPAGPWGVSGPSQVSLARMASPGATRSPSRVRAVLLRPSARALTRGRRPGLPVTPAVGLWPLTRACTGRTGLTLAPRERERGQERLASDAPHGPSTSPPSSPGEGAALRRAAVRCPACSPEGTRPAWRHARVRDAALAASAVRHAPPMATRLIY